MDMMRIDKLRQSLDMCSGAVNDHDYICDCRPCDVRAALSAIKELQAEIAQLRAKLNTALDAQLRAKLNTALEVAANQAKEVERLRSLLVCDACRGPGGHHDTGGCGVLLCDECYQAAVDEHSGYVVRGGE